MDTFFTQEEWDSLSSDEKKNLCDEIVYIDDEEYFYVDYPRYEWKRRYEECYNCGGLMLWCTCCKMYTRTCCVDYGTCECS